MLLHAGTGACAPENVQGVPCNMCVKDIALSDDTAFLLIHNGSVACAGYNNDAQLGMGNTISRVPFLTLASALAGINATRLGVSIDVTCVLSAPSQGNKVYCVGDNYRGMLGNGRNDSSAVPVAVQGLKQSAPIAQLALVQAGACVLYAGPGSDSSVQCWGNRWGQTTVPVVGVVSLVLGYDEICALMGDGTVSCWSP